MIERLQLRGVGPAQSMDLDLAPRLSILTGDNGVGKTFVLDLLWWALTRTWSGLKALPTEDFPDPEIVYTVRGSQRLSSVQATYDRSVEKWKRSRGRPPIPGLTMYLRVDGSFSVWDPARNYGRQSQSTEGDAQDRVTAFHFRPEEVWEGLELDGKIACNGLIRDWVTWQLRADRQPDSDFRLLEKVLQVLSPSPDLPLTPGEPTRLSALDVRDIPTLVMPYGTVPVLHAAAGVRRVLGFAYLLLWAWREHRIASRLAGLDTEARMVLLVDEVETHLHPRWQRKILPALLKVIEQMAAPGQVQLIASTHAPLVLASLETMFNPEQDRIFHFEQRASEVQVRPLPWVSQGDAVNWLVSETFGLAQARSVEAERAVEAAEAFMRGEASLPEGLDSREAIHRELLRTLPDHDPFWPRWIVATGNLGIPR